MFPINHVGAQLLPSFLLVPFAYPSLQGYVYLCFCVSKHASPRAVRFLPLNPRSLSGPDERPHERTLLLMHTHSRYFLSCHVDEGGINGKEDRGLDSIEHKHWLGALVNHNAILKGRFKPWMQDIRRQRKRKGRGEITFPFYPLFAGKMASTTCCISPLHLRYRYSYRFPATNFQSVPSPFELRAFTFRSN